MFEPAERGRFSNPYEMGPKELRNSGKQQVKWRFHRHFQHGERRVGTYCGAPWLIAQDGPLAEVIALLKQHELHAKCLTWNFDGF